MNPGLASLSHHCHHCQLAFGIAAGHPHHVDDHGALLDPGGIHLVLLLRSGSSSARLGHHSSHEVRTPSSPQKNQRTYTNYLKMNKTVNLFQIVHQLDWSGESNLQNK